MLHEHTVPKHTLELLGQLCPLLKTLEFYLAGGTALALRFGHRISVDLDFFSARPFSVADLSLTLEKESSKTFKILQQSEGSLCCILDGTKLEFLRYAYPLLKPIEEISGTPFASLEDNAAMKLSALANRGSKKDFVDIAELLTQKPLTSWLDIYEKKYPHSELFMVLKSLAWFEDADGEPDPIFSKNQNWSEIKTAIRDALASL